MNQHNSMPAGHGRTPQGGSRIGGRLRQWVGLWMSNGRNEGPPDLDELWRDFNRKLSRLFGGRGGNDGNNGNSGGGGNNLQPDMRGAGIGVGLVIGVVLLGWLASGVFIVQEGQQGVITSFGKYSRTVDAGIQYRLPYPFQAHEVVSFTQLQSKEIGHSQGTSGGLKDSSMLTQDENIVDIRFTVQYRLKDSREFLFENVDADQAVVQASESAVREIVGRSSMDSVLYEQRDAIAVDLSKSIQAQLDRLKTGIQIVSVNVNGVQPPEPVQAAFDDAFRANSDRERLKNEGEAYANKVIPTAQGQAARVREEAEAYRAKVVSTAEGDADRFRSVLTEYQKAPGVTRDRLYIDAMRDIYSNVTKVMVDSRNNSNLLYLPLDKLVQQQGAGNSSVTSSAPSAVTPQDPTTSGSTMLTPDNRSRDNLRSRDRDSR
ncbi:FtsH protease activity modulator HflK [Roseateles terrae]|uniref:Protein HflK n=2 Tax=Roseateles terrae TaxID=431060 RepID=A0ABR6GW86_9BURK|nr:FtsH protease activity modulator HflK [Roseateles terrae]MBB3196367.1 membrane protease subunit HflK [Roseateles terrae]OWQ83892.1 FtsH protease activity modulator HflK [Roseateles terrae]